MNKKFRVVNLIALFAIVFTLLVPSGLAMAQETEPAATTTVVVEYQDVVGPPGQISVGIIANQIPPEGLRNLDLSTTVPVGLSIVGVDTVGTEMENAEVATNVTGSIWRTVVILPADQPVPSSATGSILFYLQFAKTPIADDTNFVLTGTAEGNETVVTVQSGTARLEMIDTSGHVTTVGGDNAVGAVAKLESSTETKTFTTGIDGLFNIRSGFVGNHVLSFEWLEVIETLMVITEDDVSLLAGQVANNESNCTLKEADYTGNGTVSADDVSYIWTIALNPATHTAIAEFTPNHVSLSGHANDVEINTEVFVPYDCTRNYIFAPLGGGAASFAAPNLPETVVDGATITLSFTETRSTRFTLEGLPEDAALEATVDPIIVDGQNIPVRVGITDGNTVVISTQGRSFKDFTAHVSITSANSPSQLDISGRTNESAFARWAEDLTVYPKAPEVNWNSIYLPRVSRN